ncbi:MAG: hypothetical protein ACLQPH_15935 [Acidimicrobiales bacterium]
MPAVSAPSDPNLTDEVAVRPASREAAEEVDAVLEIEDGETTLFEAAITAFHAGEFQRAESLFLEEAEGALDMAPQRAAIAFRQAALAARRAGNVDGSDHWMRLAGREYLRVSEDARTPLPFIREAAVMAAKCFLSVENLPVATKGLRRAQAIESVLAADDDLMAPGTGIPFRRPETDDPRREDSERSAGGRRSTDRDPGRSETSTAGAPEFQVLDRDGSVGKVRVRERRSPWSRRRRGRLPNNDVA